MHNKSRLCDAVGKTITGVDDHYDGIVIAFSDNTYVALHASERHGDCEIQEVDILDTEYYNERHAAVKAGVWTNEEEIAQRQSKLGEREAKQRAWRKQQYDALKQEFGE